MAHKYGTGAELFFHMVIYPDFVKLIALGYVYKTGGNVVIRPVGQRCCHLRNILCVLVLPSSE